MGLWYNNTLLAVAIVPHPLQIYGLGMRLQDCGWLDAYTWLLILSV